MIVFKATTDALLVQATLPAGGADQLPALLLQLQSSLQGTPVKVHAAFNSAECTFYAYVFLAQRTKLEMTVATSLESNIKSQWPLWRNVRVSRLEQVLALQGASANAQAVFHYVVEMDPETGWMPELAEWYDTEHMPGLATVPGCIRATRFLNHDHGPLSLACYDLVSEETLGSPPWLAVRNTGWSSRMRPHFTHTIRTMFDCLPLPVQSIPVQSSSPYK